MPQPRLPVEIRFWRHVQWIAGCAIWIGYRNNHGYGQFHEDKQNCVKAHRWSYEKYKGEIPDGLVIDHKCRNRACVNPEHLEPVTNGENIQRGARGDLRQVYITVCKYGHPYTKENTYWIHPSRRKNPSRLCKTCSCRASQEYYKRRKQQKQMAGFLLSNEKSEALFDAASI